MNLSKKYPKVIRDTLRRIGSNPLSISITPEKVIDQARFLRSKCNPKTDEALIKSLDKLLNWLFKEAVRDFDVGGKVAILERGIEIGFAWASILHSIGNPIPKSPGRPIKPRWKRTEEKYYERISKKLPVTSGAMWVHCSNFFPSHYDQASFERTFKRKLKSWRKKRVT